MRQLTALLPTQQQLLLMVYVMGKRYEPFWETDTTSPAYVTACQM